MPAVEPGFLERGFIFQFHRKFITGGGEEGLSKPPEPPLYAL